MTAGKKWVRDQLDALAIKDSDPRYSEAKQAAEAGWPAKKIAKLIGFDRSGSGER